MSTTLNHDRHDDDHHPDYREWGRQPFSYQAIINYARANGYRYRFVTDTTDDGRTARFLQVDYPRDRRSLSSYQRFRPGPLFGWVPMRGTRYQADYLRPSRLP